MAARTEEERELSVGIVVEASVLGLTSLMVSLAFFLFNVRLRSNRIIKMTSPILNLFTACGGILLSVCVAMYGLDYFLRDVTNAASAVCQTRASLLACGSTLLFGPMFLKSWRVYRLFKNAWKKRVIIKDSRLLLMTAGLLLLDVILLLIWQTTDPLLYRPLSIYRQIGLDSGESNTSTSTTTATALQITRVHTCTSPSSPSWLAAFLFLKMALLCYGLFLSWQTRAVALPAMNDSRCIVVSALTTVTVATLAISVSHVLHEHPNVVYACVVLAVWSCTMVTLCLAFIPKVSLWWRNPETKGLRVSVTSVCSSSSPLFPLQNWEEELCQAAAENEALRKTLEEKDSTIRQLQQYLTNAYKRLSHMGLNLDLIQDNGPDADYSSSSSSSSSETMRDRTKPSVSPSRHHHSLADSMKTPCCDEFVARNDHSSSMEMIQGENSSVKFGKGSSNSPGVLELGHGGFLSSPESGGLGSSLCERKDSDSQKIQRRIERESSCHSGSYGPSQSSNTNGGDSPVYVPSVNFIMTSQVYDDVRMTSHTQGCVGMTSKGQVKSSRMTSYDGEQVVPSLRRRRRRRSLGKNSRWYREQECRSATPALPPAVNGEALESYLTSRQNSTFSETPKASSTHSSDRSYKRKRCHQRRRHSANSVTSVEKLTELRAAIALDLQHARSLSNVLSNSVSKELDNIYRRHSRRLRRRSSLIKSKEELAESIVGSYGLDNTTDNRSYVSSLLPIPSLRERNMDLPTSRTELYILDNDGFYPERRHKDSMTSLYGLEKGQGYVLKDEGYSLGRSSDSGSRARDGNLSYQGKPLLIHREEIVHRDTQLSLKQIKTKRFNPRHSLPTVSLNTVQNTNLKSVKNLNPLNSIPNANSLNSISDVYSSNSTQQAISLKSVQNGRPNEQGDVEDRNRSELGVQNRSEHRQEVFSVHVAHSPQFVQKGYAHTRALYSTDTFI